MAELKRVICRNNGPYRVMGPLEVEDEDGKVTTMPAEMVFLCRCGGSATKPFCDGTHKTNGFKSRG